MDRGFQKARICLRLFPYEEDHTVLLLLPFFNSGSNPDGPMFRENRTGIRNSRGSDHAHHLNWTAIIVDPRCKTLRREKAYDPCSSRSPLSLGGLCKSKWMRTAHGTGSPGGLRW